MPPTIEQPRLGAGVGYVESLPQPTAEGLIRGSDYRGYRFGPAEWCGVSPPSVPTAVEFEPVPAADGQPPRARAVRPISAPWREGRVEKNGTPVHIALDDDEVVEAFPPCVRGGPLRPNDRVRCVVVLGSRGGLFALVVEPVPEPEPVAAARPQPAVGAWTQKGTRASKSVNDDAYLVAPLADGAVWLVAVSDGVSTPPNGWWASDKCMDLLWDTFSAPVEELLAGRPGPEVMRAWVNEVRSQFLQGRLGAPNQYKDATATLTYALVRDRTAYYAHCGDTRLYVAGPEGGFKPQAIIGQGDIERGKVSAKQGLGNLASHIANADTYWRPVVGTVEIPAGGVLLLCSDGVIAGGQAVEKFNRLSQSLRDPGGLQERVTAAVARIATMGEADDLTLLVFQPGEL